MMSAQTIFTYLGTETQYLKFFTLHIFVSLSLAVVTFFFHYVHQDVSLRTASADARPRITSEIGTSMRYPSYLERGPDYEAEMRYFSGDSLMSPRVGFIPLNQMCRSKFWQKRNHLHKIFFVRFNMVISSHRMRVLNFC